MSRLLIIGCGGVMVLQFTSVVRTAMFLQKFAYCKQDEIKV